MIMKAIALGVLVLIFAAALRILYVVLFDSKP